MPVMTLFYLLVAGTFVLAYARLKVLDARRARAARRLGAARDTTVVPLVHRLETVTLLGLPLYRYVTVPLADEVVAALGRIPAERPVDLLVHLPGGLAVDVAIIAEAARERTGPVTLIVPVCALSGSGAIAAAADVVVAGPGAVLDSADTVAGAGSASMPSAGSGSMTGAGPAVSPAAQGATVPEGAWELLALYDQPPRRRRSPLFLPLSRRGRGPATRG